VEAAVAWARAHAPVVLVRLDGDDFRRSAGEAVRSAAMAAAVAA